jgi:O-succinylbenzoic acid--CoA ligase
MPEWLASRAASSGDRLALRCGAVEMTFADLDREADAMARRLASFSLGAGARVAALLDNGAPFVVLTHAVARLGAILVPLNTRLTAAELAWQLSDARADVVVSAADLQRRAAEAASGGGVRALSWDVVRQAGATADPAGTRVDPPRTVRLADPQAIVYTSATSGRPKGVMLSFGNHWWSAIGSALNLGLHRDDRWLAPLPLFHVGGLSILWRSVIYGIGAVVAERFDPGDVNDAIDKDDITIVSVVSTMLQRMLEARRGRPYPPALRCVLLGGGPAPASLIAQCVAHGVPVAPTYGLTEAASQVAALHPDEVTRRPGSAGRPLLPNEVRIHEGEILVRGPSVMMGYADRPDATARAVRDGWLHTGDMGYLDDDGYLYVRDRREDLVISGGENVYPAEVEAVLREHPGVEDAAVVGMPDPTWGQTVAAAVVRRSGAASGSAIGGSASEHANEAALIAHCEARLAKYKVPRTIWFVPDLPRSPGGKVLRGDVRAHVPPPRAPSAPAGSA